LTILKYKGRRPAERCSSMMRRIAAIFLILSCTSIAWAILGTTIFARTYDVGSNLASRVESTWGAPEEQWPPAIGYLRQQTKKVETEENGKKVTRLENQEITLASSSTKPGAASQIPT